MAEWLERMRPYSQVVAVRVSEFLADCSYSHRLPDDPIVFPGMPGASHMHNFFGSRVTNAHTTVTDLLNGPSDRIRPIIKCGADGRPS